MRCYRGPVPAADQTTVDLLRLTLTTGLGPILIARLLERFGSASEACRASAAMLERIQGIGPAKAASIRSALDASGPLADEELALAERLGVRLISRADPAYPALLRHIPDPPPLLYCRGSLGPDLDRWCVGIVGSRACTAYGVEQAERFASSLASAGLTIVSGGARGIDTAAHRAALRLRPASPARTLVIMGCGLAHCYPPENRELFDHIASSGAGAILSELPLRTGPAAENFPSRNRIISGISLGVLLVEAAKGSGALITARAAAEDHNREVMAVPGRVDSPASEGANDLLKSGGAALVTTPNDVLQLLETPARHAHEGSHESRYANAPAAVAPPSLFDSALNDTQRSILQALESPLTLDDLAGATGLAVHTLLAETTALELKRILERDGNRLRRRMP